MNLDGAKLRTGNAKYTIASGKLKVLNPITGDVRGSFVLAENKIEGDLSSGVVIEGASTLEVRLLTVSVQPDGVRKYRFVAVCRSEEIASLDLMLHPAKHPTILENLMH
jgi:hypothetical protein